MIKSLKFKTILLGLFRCCIFIYQVVGRVIFLAFFILLVLIFILVFVLIIFINFVSFCNSWRTCIQIWFVVAYILFLWLDVNFHRCRFLSLNFVIILLFILVLQSLSLIIFSLVFCVFLKLLVCLLVCFFVLWSDSIIVHHCFGLSFCLCCFSSFLFLLLFLLLFFTFCFLLFCRRTLAIRIYLSIAVTHIIWAMFTDIIEIVIFSTCSLLWRISSTVVRCIPSSIITLTYKSLVFIIPKDTFFLASICRITTTTQCLSPDHPSSYPKHGLITRIELFAQHAFDIIFQCHATLSWWSDHVVVLYLIINFLIGQTISIIFCINQFWVMPQLVFDE